VRRASLRAEVAVLVALAVASGAIRAVLGETSGYTFPASMLPGTFLWFVPGMLLAIWSVVHPERFRPEHGLRYWLVAAAAFAGVCVLGAVGAPRYLADDLLTPVIGFFVLAPAIAGAAAARTRASLPQTLLATRPLAWLGLVSYAVYLYHATLMAWLENHGAGNIFPVHWIGLAVTTLALTAAVAAASWYAIERPMLSLAGRRRRARRVRPAVAGAEPAAQPAGTAG
jgi:peptidoglycan/LPS O-acetylase OafA/YrhL